MTYGLVTFWGLTYHEGKEMTLVSYCIALSFNINLIVLYALSHRETFIISFHIMEDIACLCVRVYIGNLDLLTKWNHTIMQCLTVTGYFLHNFWIRQCIPICEYFLRNLHISILMNKVIISTYFQNKHYSQARQQDASLHGKSHECSNTL